MSTENEKGAMSCPNPVDAAVLADYWAGALPASEEEAVEVHLLGCDRCGDRLREMIALAEGVRRLAREGNLRIIVSEAFLKRATEEGLRIRQYAPPSGGSVQCTVTAEDDILIGRLAADATGAKRVDLRLYDERGAEQYRLVDIPVRAGISDVIFQESITFWKAAPSCNLVARLVAFDEAGRERLIGEYTFHHTRSLPGPGAW